MDIETAAKQFLKHLVGERGCTDATAEAYASDVRQCVAYLSEKGIPPQTEVVTSAVLREYVGWLAHRGCSASTIRRRISGVSSLWRWLTSTEHETANPCAGLMLPRKQRWSPAVLTLEEARRLLAASEEHDHPAMAFRNRAAISTLLFCGLRRGELLDLTTSDVDHCGRWVRVRRGKGGKGRSVPLVAEAAEAVSDWLEFRPEVEHDFLFTGRRGARLGKNGIARMFRRVARHAGVLREGVSLHTLRHTFASLLLQQGCDLVSIKEMLGHADLSTTGAYLHLDASHLQAAADLHPLSGASPTAS